MSGNPINSNDEWVKLHNYHEDPGASWERHMREHGGVVPQTISIRQEGDKWVASSGQLTAEGSTDLQAAGNLQRILSERHAHLEF